MTHTGPNNVTRLTKQNTSYKMPWIQIYDTTVLDSWFVGDYSSASYHITVEFDSNQKETMQVLVVARPDHASYTVFGRTCIQDELITLTATVTASIMTLTANPSNPNFAGAKVIFNALYAETITPLALPTVVLPSSSGTAGMPTPSNLYGTFGTINVANQPSINAGYELDTLTLANGNGIGITSNSVTKTITVSSNVTVFSSIAVAGGNILTPASATDTLTLSGSNGVSITADTNSKTVNISVSLPAATTTTIGGVKVDGDTIVINNGVISGAITYTLPTASDTELGGVKVDNSTITINPLTGVISGAITYTLPVSTSVILGGVKQGSNVTIAGDGTISVAAPYSLPVSTSVILGGVKQGSNVTIAGDGTISVAAPYTLTAATTSALGGVIIPVVATSGITNTSGTIGLAVATNTQLGGVKIDNSTITINNGVISLSSSITTGLTIGTTLTIPTGDTLSRPTATQGNLRFNTSLGKFEGYYGSAWGAVGGGLSPTAIQTANGYVAKANDLVRCNTTSGAFSITLPSAPVDGDIIGVIDTHRKFALNNLTILAAGSKTIEDDPTSLVIDITGSYIELVYNDVNSNWRILETPMGTGTSSTTIITSNGYVAFVNDLVRCDTTAAAFSVTLPTSPIDGSIVNFVDVASAGSFFANNLTVLAGSGNTVQNSASLILNVNGTYVSLVYNLSTTNWKLLQYVSSSTALGATGVSTTVAGPLVVAESLSTATTGVSSSSWATSGVNLKLQSRTYTDTSSTGTVASSYVNVMASPTLASTNAVTITNAASLFVDAPIASTNTTITNGWAIYCGGKIRATDLVLANALPIAQGGTGATSAANALAALGAYAATNPSGFTSNTGTVTSVGISVPTFLSAGSAITSSGTIAISLSGTALPIANGGTGATSAANALAALGAYAATNPSGFTSNTGTVTSVGISVPTFLSAGSAITSSGTIAISLSGTALPIANGGTGSTTLTLNNVLLGNGTSALQAVAPGANGNVLTSNGTTWTSAAASSSLTAGKAIALAMVMGF